MSKLDYTSLISKVNTQVDVIFIPDYNTLIHQLYEVAPSYFCYNISPFIPIQFIVGPDCLLTFWSLFAF